MIFFLEGYSNCSGLNFKGRLSQLNTPLEFISHHREEKTQRKNQDFLYLITIVTRLAAADSEFPPHLLKFLLSVVAAQYNAPHATIYGEGKSQSARNFPLQICVVGGNLNGASLKTCAHSEGWKNHQLTVEMKAVTKFIKWRGS